MILIPVSTDHVPDVTTDCKVTLPVIIATLNSIALVEPFKSVVDVSVN